MTKELKPAFGDVLTGRLASIAGELRYIADAVDRLAADVPAIGTSSTPSAGYLAERTVQQVMSGLANAKVEAVIAAAADYDRNVTYAPEPAPVREPRRWPVDSEEPRESGLLVASPITGIKYHFQAVRGRWAALRPEGDGREYDWREINHDPVGTPLVEVLDDTPDGAR